MTTPPEEPRRSAPRFIVPVPVGSVAPRGDETPAAPAVAAPRQAGRRPRITRLDRPDAVAFAVILLWVSFALSVASAIAVVVALGAAAVLADETGGSVVPDGFATAVLVVTALVLVVQLVLAVLVARGSDVARAGLAVVAALVGALAIVGGGAAGLGAVVLVVAVAALFVPSSSTWFREVRARGGAR